MPRPAVYDYKDAGVKAAGMAGGLVNVPRTDTRTCTSRAGKGGETALELAERDKKTDVAKLLRSMMVLLKTAASKAATKGGKM